MSPDSGRASPLNEGIVEALKESHMGGLTTLVSTSTLVGLFSTVESTEVEPMNNDEAKGIPDEVVSPHDSDYVRQRNCDFRSIERQPLPSIDATDNHQL
jgi:hypothetical protein